MTHHSMFRGAKQAEVVAGYNENPNFIVYDGHGNQQGMTELPLVISDLDKLRNTHRCRWNDGTGQANSTLFPERTWRLCS